MCRRQRWEQKTRVHRYCSSVSSNWQVDPLYSSELSGYNLSSQKWMVSNYPYGHQAQRWGGEAGSHDSTILLSWYSFQIVPSSLWIDYKKEAMAGTAQILATFYVKLPQLIYVTLIWGINFKSHVLFTVILDFWSWCNLSVINCCRPLKINNCSIKCPRIGVLACLVLWNSLKCMLLCNNTSQLEV